MPELLQERGPYGRALQLEIRPDEPRMAPTVDHWLITAPGYHAAWNQYVLSCVRLDELPGWPSPALKFPGATHELLLLALNPEPGPQTRETMAEHCRTGRLPFLEPVNLAEQYQATDEEMRHVCQRACRAIVQGRMSPEPPLGYESFREAWLAATTRTLACIRGEAHAAGL